MYKLWTCIHLLSSSRSSVHNAVTSTTDFGRACQATFDQMQLCPTPVSLQQQRQQTLISSSAAKVSQSEYDRLPEGKWFTHAEA